MHTTDKIALTMAASRSPKNRSAGEPIPSSPNQTATAACHTPHAQVVHTVRHAQRATRSRCKPYSGGPTSTANSPRAVGQPQRWRRTATLGGSTQHTVKLCTLWTTAPTSHAPTRSLLTFRRSSIISSPASTASDNTSAAMQVSSTPWCWRENWRLKKPPGLTRVNWKSTADAEIGAGSPHCAMAKYQNRGWLGSCTSAPGAACDRLRVPPDSRRRRPRTLAECMWQPVHDKGARHLCAHSPSRAVDGDQVVQGIDCVLGACHHQVLHNGVVEHKNARAI